jgi:hypothetical protein
MTLGPDLDWLADDEGNLRPEAARVIGQTPPPAAAPRPVPPRPAPRVPVNLGARLPRVVVPAPWLPVALIVAVLVGVGLGRAGRVRVENSRPASTNDALPTPPEFESAAVAKTALVNAVNVNLRAAPGLFAPVLWKLRPGEVVRVGAEREGWFAVASTSGLQGYVFGALLRGVASSQGQPAAITVHLRAALPTGELSLKPGDRVIAHSSGDGTAIVLVPSGHRIRVQDDALAFLD